MGAACLVLALREWRQLGVVGRQHGGVCGVGLEGAVVPSRVSLPLQALDVLLSNTHTRLSLTYKAWVVR